MKPVEASLVFAASYFFVLTVVTAVAIYGYDHFEPAWGPGISMQVVLWILGCFAFLAFVSHWLGQALAPGKRRLSAAYHLLAGGAMAGYLAALSTIDVEASSLLISLAIIGLPCLIVGFFSAGIRPSKGQVGDALDP